LTANRGTDGQPAEYSFMEQHGTDLDAIIPKTVVFAKAEELDLAPSDDRFDRFRKAKLLNDLVQVPGTTQHGFTKDQANRFIFLLAVGKPLGKRPRLSALAFWLCWYGVAEVRPDLICEHVERTIIAFLRYIRREFNRKRVPPKAIRNPRRWERAGDPWAKSILKIMLRRAVDNPLARQVLSSLVGWRCAH
jgi:hypothetical protein